MVILRNAIEVYEVDDIKFTLRPQEYQDFGKAIDFAESLNLQGERARNIVSGYDCLMERIVEWEGVELSLGEPAPCTPENKRTLFAQVPTLLRKLGEAVAEREKVEEKNSETSQDG